MDDADLTSACMEMEEQIRRRNSGAGLEAEAVGKCLHCEAPLADGHRFCDPTCRDDWEHTRKLLAMAGAMR